MPSPALDRQDELTEATVTGDDVYLIGFNGDKPTGTLTTKGEQLQKQNPALLSSLVAQAQGAAYKRASRLYPKCSVVADSEVNKYRTNRPIGEVKPASASSPAKPAVPSTEELATLFGRTSDAGKANALAKADLGKYKRLRALAVEAGLVALTERERRIASIRKS